MRSFEFSLVRNEREFHPVRLLTRNKNLRRGVEKWINADLNRDDAAWFDASGKAYLNSHGTDLYINARVYRRMYVLQNSVAITDEHRNVYADHNYSNGG